MTSNKELDDLYNHALDLILKGMSPEIIKPPIFKVEYIEEIKKRLRVEREVITEAHVLGRNDDEYWYSPSNFRTYYWKEYKNKLIEKNFPDISIENIDSSTTKILKLMSHPELPSFKKHGLVMGHVQSGKTANYTGLIAKAIDCGYKNIIIFSGIHNNLRDQTQKRIEEDLFLFNNDKQELNIHYLTKQGDKDFDDSQHTSIFLNTNPKIFIIKKQWKVLEKLINWFSSFEQEILANYPTIIIDDEADNATIDVSKDSNYDEEYYEIEDDDPSLTNQYIRTLRNLFQKVCYVGYTATPFANVLIDPFEEHEEYGEPLYPKDFIIALPKPIGYSGTDELFPTLTNAELTADHEPYDHIYLINENDHNHLLNENSLQYKYLLPESLKIAFYHFLITAVLRDNRNIKNNIHSFLIHIHHEISAHKFIKNKFENFFEQFTYQFSLPKPYDSDVITEIELFKDYWEHIKIKLSASDYSYDEIKQAICDIFQKINIVDINSESKDELDFSDLDGDKFYIIIGGNRLSRGLTIEGLTVTYFTRSSKYYDTLLQMGRWFGFRKGYEDLIKIFTTTENYYWFNWLNNVEESIRRDIERYDKYDKTPLQLAVRIKTHPGMHVTSPLKMKNTTEFSLRPSFNGRTYSTLDFHLDTTSLQKNINHTNRFIGKLSNKYKLSIKKENWLWENVAIEICAKFLENLLIPLDSTSFPKSDIMEYIDRLNREHQELSRWSVLLANNTQTKKHFDVAGYNVGLANRSKVIGKNSSLIILQNSLFDLDLKNGETRHPDNALLIIHIIDKDSIPANFESYEPWFKENENKNHIIGLVIVFPNSDNAEREDYIAITGIPTDVN